MIKSMEQKDFYLFKSCCDSDIEKELITFLSHIKTREELDRIHDIIEECVCQVLMSEEDKNKVIDDLKFHSELIYGLAEMGIPNKDLEDNIMIDKYYYHFKIENYKSV